MKCSTTHSASRKEVVVFSSPPVHWNTNPVVPVVNSLLGQHKKALHAVLETRNHLGGLSLVMDAVPTEDKLQILYRFFDSKAKASRGDDTKT